MSFLGFARIRKSELSGAAATSSVAAMIGVLFAGSTLLTPLYIMYKQRFGFSQITLTLIYAVYIVGNLAALLFFGHTSDKIGRRVTTLGALAVGTVSVLLFLLAADTATLYIARAMSGLAIGVGVGTGTAWLAELIGEEDKTRATTVATSTNFFGLAVGALVAGLLAQYAPWPLHLPFIVYLVTLLAVAVLIWRCPETVAPSVDRLQDIPLRPRLSVPRDIRASFVAPAVTGFGALALVGFYAALAPSILANDLHEKSHAAAGAVFFELALAVSISIVATQRLSSRAAMLWALALMMPSAVMVVAAQTMGSMAIMIAGTALCGVASGLGYRGSLQVVNQLAPADRRAEVVSSYFVCLFCGNALPVIGMGVISTLVTPAVASLSFAAMIAIFALVALGFGVKYTR